MILTQLYVRGDILLTNGTHLHEYIISLRGEGVQGHKTSLTLPLLLKCLHQARSWGYQFCL